MTLYCEKDGNGADEVDPTGSCEGFIAKPNSHSWLCNCGNCIGAIEL